MLCSTKKPKRSLINITRKRRPTYKPHTNRLAKVYEQDHDDEDIPNNPESDLDNHHVEDSYPMQDSDVEELIDFHGNYSAIMTFAYHIYKHSVSSFWSLGADVCVLERTGRKVSVTGIDDHELPCLDIVTCVALIQTNHGKVNLLMHEYAYYGKGNTIHSHCQIEWFQNECHDKSHHVGGRQVSNVLNGYATPLECRSGLIYMSLLGKPTDQDLEEYPHVLLTSPYEWDPSVLDYAHPNTSGYPPWGADPSARDQHNPRMDECGNFQNRL